MSREVGLLHPELRKLCAAFVHACEKQGLRVGISQTWRSKAEQDALYAQGRTRKGPIVTNCKYPYSPHNWGLAFDIYRKDGRGAYDDSDGWFRKCGEVGRSVGLFWGGDFKTFVDQPHFELASYLPENSCKTLLARYGTPENFKITWKDDEMKQEEFDKLMEDYLARRGTLSASAWAAEELAQAREKGITDGNAPRSFATREEVAAMVLRAVR